MSRKSGLKTFASDSSLSTNYGGVMSRSTELVHLEDVDISGETEKAFKVVYLGEELWMPKSQIADLDNYTLGDAGVTMSVTKWIADIKELSYAEE